MSTVFLPGDDQLVTDLPSHDDDDDFIAFDIIQGSKVARAQFVLGHEIGTHPLDGTSGSCRLVLESRRNHRLQCPPVAYW